MSRDPILDAFAFRARRHPGVAVVVSPTRTASAEDVAALASAVAGMLASARPAPGRPIALAAPNGPGFLAAWVGARAGGHAVTLLDERTPRAERREIAGRLGAAAIVACDVRWPAAAADVTVETLDPSPVDLPDEAASIRLTSGSTGMPRGIVHTSEALLADDRQLTASMSLGETERILASVPLSHAYGFASIALPALVRSSVMVVPDDDGPFAALDATSACGVTFLPTVPAYLQAVVRMAEPPPLPESTRLVISAGAPLPPATAERFRALYGRSVHVFYGASEVGGITYDREGDSGERGTLGTPVEGVRVELRPSAGAGPGEGLVVVHSAAASSGTLPDADPRLADGVFETSDLGRLGSTGELVLVGRVDDVVNIRGKKVQPREVERVVAAMPGVDEAVVVGIAAPDGGAALRAVVACRPGAVDEAAIRRWCLDRLASHKVPRGIVLVEELPRTPRGKIDHRAVRAIVGA